MKTKILLMAALLAATTAFFSCSSDETLAEVLPEEPQPAEVLPTDSGIPLTVTASTGNDTRAAELTNSNFNSFQLWAFEGATPWVGNAYDEENRQVGKEMEKDAETGWNAPGANWPNLNTDSKFYAISADYSSNNALTPHIEKGNASFTYTVASDAADQEDLLVGSTTASTATNNGKVDIEFDHILSKLNFTFKMDPSTIDLNEWSVNTGQGLAVIIHQIEIHGLKNSGKYTFGNGWSEQSGDGTVIITLDKDITVVAGFDVANNGVEGEGYREWAVLDGYGITSISADAFISNPGLVMPQEVTNIWTPNVYNLEGAYLVLKAKTVIYMKDSDSEYDGAAKYYFEHAVDDAENKLFTLSEKDADNHQYYLNALGEKVARDDGVILDFSKLPEGHEIDLQVRTSIDGDVGNTGFNVLEDTDFGNFYKPLGAGTFEFEAGHPYRMTLNLLTGLNDANHSPWGDFGEAGGAPKFNDIISWE